MKSCDDCPSYLANESQVKAVFDRTLGAEVAVCAQTGAALGRPRLPAAQLIQIRSLRAEACGKHGTPIPADPPRMTPVVAIPDLIDPTTGAPYERPHGSVSATVNSCSACRFFVDPATVREEFGWAAGLCSIEGRLIPSNETRSAPRRCGMATPGDVRDSTDGITLVPEFEPGGIAAAHVSGMIRQQRDFVEPTDYESDKELDDDDVAQGIRAWRNIYSPTDPTKYVAIPVFAIDSFDDAEQAKIPRTGDDEHPEWYVDHLGLLYTFAVEFMELDETPALIGPAGVGKTEAFRVLAWMMCCPFDRINVSKSTEVDDLVGRMLVRGDGNGGTETYWQDGRLTIRWSTRGIVVVDEANLARDDVWELLRPLTDNSKELVLDQNDGEVRSRHCYTFLGLTMNPSWDTKYVGAQDMNEANGNRLTSIWVDLPPAEVERSIITQRCEADGYDVGAATLDKIMAIATEIRGLTDTGALQVAWGLRPQIAVARKMRWYDGETAYRRAVTDRLDPEQQEMILRIVRAHTEGVLTP